MEKKQSLVVFEDTEVNVGFKNNEIEMDMEELARAIGSNQTTLRQILTRNSELQEDEFSYLKKVEQIENGVMKRREKRFFTEQGIYEITLLARTDRAKKFRKFARELITKYRQDELQLKTAISIQTNEKLDTIMALIKERDGEIGDIVEFFIKAKETFAKIDTMEKNIKTIIETQDELVKTVNGLIDEVEEREDV